MDDGSDWRVIDADSGEVAPSAHGPVAGGDEHIPRWLIGAIVAVIGVACAIAMWVTLPSGGVAVEASDAPFDVNAAVGDVHAARTLSVATATIVVDIEGAVAAPGTHKLVDGSRVGDAIAAAGGYAANVNIEAAGRGLNLAAKLTDGQQIRVPALGDATAPSTSAAAAPGAGGDPIASGGLIGINHATAEQLDTLPGIGPVTAQKIIDARTEAPFGTIDELQTRGVVGPSTFEKLRDLITANP